MPTRLKAIILKKKPSGDESLYIDTLLENGEFGGFKIPGILKSAKRSSFHFAPGAIYEMIFSAAASPGQRVIPKSSELIFSPFSESQDYQLLTAIAEIVQIAEFVKGAPDNAALFELMADTLENVARAQQADKYLDDYYWNFLSFLGLAAEAEPDMAYAAYDLATGFLTQREVSEKPRGDFWLPYPVQGAAARETIRRYLKSL